MKNISTINKKAYWSATKTSGKTTLANMLIDNFNKNA